MIFRREWATPLTIGCFIIMSITGILMFFHYDQGLNKIFHQWVSWAFIGGVFVHILSNWPTFPRYFTTEVVGRTLIVTSIIILSASFYSWGVSKDDSPAFLALRSVSKVPITQLAELTGTSTDSLIRALSMSGIDAKSGNVSIESLAKGNRKIQSKIVRIIFGDGAK